LIQEFNVKSSLFYSEEGFQIASLISALEDLKKRDDEKRQTLAGFCINPIIVDVKVNTDVSPYDLYYKASSEPVEKEANPNMFGSFINTLNPFAK
jgi:hypothetical protein